MIRVIVVDDERRAAAMLRHLLEEIGGIRVEGVYTNPLEALRDLESGRTHPEAAFLDIDMPMMLGTELAQRILNVDDRIHVIFATAYSEYAIEAFELHSLDYVLKPINKERLEKSVQRLRSSLRSRADRPAEGANLSIRCFGKFSLQAGDGTPLRWRTARTKELCAFLVHHAGHAVDRDLILDTIWPDTPMDKALAQLYTIASYLRKMFADRGLRQMIAKDDAGYRMDLSPILCDALEFRRLAASGMENDLERAVRLYEGDYLQEEHYEWAIARQEELKREAVSIYERLAGLGRARGDLRQAAAHAERALLLAPYSDELCRMLMTLRADNGERSEALLVYRRFEETVRVELRAEPDERTRLLYLSLSDSSPA